MCFTMIFNAKKTGKIGFSHNIVKNETFIFKIKNIYSFKEWKHYLDTTDKTELSFTLS